MAVSAAEEEQIQQLKKWWRQYGKAIIVAIVLGLLVGYGWRYWQNHKMKVADQASVSYQQLLQAVKTDPSNVPVLANKLIHHASGTSYASFAELLLAKYDVDQNNLPAAAKQLKSVIAQSSDSGLVQIAKIRLARILLAEQQPKKALSVLSGIDGHDFSPLVDSVKGDIYLALAKPKMAKKYYKNASVGLAKANINNPFISLKASQR